MKYSSELPVNSIKSCLEVSSSKSSGLSGGGWMKRTIGIMSSSIKRTYGIIKTDLKRIFLPISASDELRGLEYDEV